MIGARGPTGCYLLRNDNAAADERDAQCSEIFNAAAKTILYAQKPQLGWMDQPRVTIHYHRRTTTTHRGPTVSEAHGHLSLCGVSVTKAQTAGDMEGWHSAVSFW